MRPGNAVFGERSLSKVAAVFADQAAARAACRRLQHELGLGEAQVRLVAPDDPHPGRKIEPESRGIMHTAIRAHITLGLLGLVAGVVLFLALWATGIGAVRSSPWVAAAIIVSFATVFGLLAGGLVTLRPDHDRLVLAVREAIATGRYAVVAHPTDRAQREQVLALMRDASGEVLRTL